MNRAITLIAVIVVMTLLIPVGVIAGSGAFLDDDGTWYETDAEWLAGAGITTGCAPDQFCGEDPVTRGQMAAFLHRFAGYLDQDSVSDSIVIGAASFTHDGARTDYFFDIDGGYIRPRDGNWCGQAPVDLPDGATITQVTGYLYDNTSPGYTTLELRRKDFKGTGPAQWMGGGTTVGTSTAVQEISDTSIDYAVVDNHTFMYFLSSCMPGTDHNLRLYAGEVFFDRPDPTP